MKHHISYLYKALIRYYIKHDVKHQLQIKQINSHYHKVCSKCPPLALTQERKHTDGTVISWVDEMRYLGIFIVRSRTFNFSPEHAKKSFYRAANAVFAKIGRLASE